MSTTAFLVTTILLSDIKWYPTTGENINHN